MTRRVPASMRTRESLSDLIEGRLSVVCRWPRRAGEAGDAVNCRGGVGGGEP